jgi:thymidylate kinase
MHPTIAFVKEFLDIVQENEIKMLSLRYKPFSEEMAFEGDYDFVTSVKDIDTVLSILFSLATEKNVNFSINRLRFGKVAVTVYSSCDDKTILLEIWNYLDVKRDSFLPFILWEDIEPVVLFDKEKGYILPLEIESLYYLSHLKSKKKNLHAALVQERLRYYKDALALHKSEISQLYGELLQNSEKRDEVGAKANTILVERKILFRKDDRQRSAQIQKLRLKISLHRIYAQLLYKSKIFPVVGPDGVGKTSIIEALQSRVAQKIKYYRFKRLFRHNILYKISRLFLATKEEKKLEKNQYDDIHGVWMFYIALLYFPFLLLARAISGKIYFSDRWFHDLLLQDTRFLDKKAQLRRAWKRVLKKAPNSYWFIHLDAPNDIILSRKNELNYDAIDRYRHDIFAMYLEKPSLVYSYVNTSLALQLCVDDLIDTGKLAGLKEKKFET